MHSWEEYLKEVEWERNKFYTKTMEMEIRMAIMHKITPAKTREFATGIEEYKIILTYRSVAGYMVRYVETLARGFTPLQEETMNKVNNRIEEIKKALEERKCTIKEGLWRIL
jgi:hypothetical protein